MEFQSGTRCRWHRGAAGRLGSACAYAVGSAAERGWSAASARTAVGEPPWFVADQVKHPERPSSKQDTLNMRHEAIGTPQHLVFATQHDSELPAPTDTPEGSKGTTGWAVVPTSTSTSSPGTRRPPRDACASGRGPRFASTDALAYRGQERLPSDTAVKAKARGPVDHSTGPLACCALGRIRTCNLLIRSQMLYPLSYECLSSVLPGGFAPWAFLPGRRCGNNIT